MASTKVLAIQKIALLHVSGSQLDHRLRAFVV